MNTFLMMVSYRANAADRDVVALGNVQPACLYYPSVTIESVIDSLGDFAVARAIERADLSVDMRTSFFARLSDAARTEEARIALLLEANRRGNAAALRALFPSPGSAPMFGPATAPFYAKIRASSEVEVGIDRSWVAPLPESARIVAWTIALCHHSPNLPIEPMMADLASLGPDAIVVLADALLAGGRPGEAALALTEGGRALNRVRDLQDGRIHVVRAEYLGLLARADELGVQVQPEYSERVALIKALRTCPSQQSGAVIWTRASTGSWTSATPVNHAHAVCARRILDRESDLSVLEVIW